MVRASVAGMVVLLVGLVWSPVRADETPDLSTPKKAAVNFAKALETENLAAAKGASVGTADDYKLLETIVGFISANRQLQNAAVARFGDEGKQVAGEDMSNLSKQMQDGGEKIDGDTATVGKADDKDPLKLKKVDGRWKVDLAAIPEKEQLARMMPKMRKVIADAAADIKAGKYKTADEAKQAIAQQMFAIIAEQINVPQDAPSTGQAPAAQK